MVEDQKLEPDECVSIVKNYFENILKGFELSDNGNYTGYWWVEYSSKGDVRIYFDGDIGGHFSVKIFIGNTEYSLWQFDKSVNTATKSTRKNILYQLDVLKRFLITL